MCKIRLHAASLLIFAFSLTPVAAQDPYTNQGQLVSIEPGLIRLVTVTGEPLTVKALIPGEPGIPLSDGRTLVGVSFQARVQGEVDASRIKPRMAVRFVARVHEGAIEEPVRELTVFDPTEVDQPGMFEHMNDPNDESPGTNYLIKGRITSFRSSRMVIDVGRGAPQGVRRLGVPIADNPKVHFESDNLVHASPGDHIVIKGGKMKQDIFALEVVVTLQPPKPRPGSKKQPQQPGTFGPPPK